MQTFQLLESLREKYSTLTRDFCRVSSYYKANVKQKSADGGHSTIDTRYFIQPPYSVSLRLKRWYTSADLRSKTIALSSLLKIPLARYFTPFSQEGITARIRSTITAF